MPDLFCWLLGGAYILCFGLLYRIVGQAKAPVWAAPEVLNYARRRLAELADEEDAMAAGMRVAFREMSTLLVAHSDGRDDA